MAFISLHRVHEKDFDFALLIDRAQTNAMEAYAALAAAFAVCQLDANPMRIVLEWGT